MRESTSLRENITTGYRGTNEFWSRKFSWVLGGTCGTKVRSRCHVCLPSGICFSPPRLFGSETCFPMHVGPIHDCSGPGPTSISSTRNCLPAASGQQKLVWTPGGLIPSSRERERTFRFWGWGWVGRAKGRDYSGTWGNGALVLKLWLEVDSCSPLTRGSESRFLRRAVRQPDTWMLHVLWTLGIPCASNISTTWELRRAVEHQALPQAHCIWTWPSGRAHICLKLKKHYYSAEFFFLSSVGMWHWLLHCCGGLSWAEWGGSQHHPPLPAYCQDQPVLSCDNQTYLQTWPDVPGGETAPLENHCCRRLKEIIY